jgi:hypothetical protein
LVQQWLEQVMGRLGDQGDLDVIPLEALRGEESTKPEPITITLWDGRVMSALSSRFVEGALLGQFSPALGHGQRRLVR